MTSNRFILRTIELVRRFWIDALVFVGVAMGIVAVLYDRHEPVPQGPRWFDILVVSGFTLPLLARRRFPLAAPLAVAVIVGSTSFVDKTLLTNNFVAFLAGIAVCALLGMRPNRVQSVGGLLFLWGIAAVVIANDPKGQWSDMSWNCITFTIAWLVGYAIARQSRETDEAEEQARRAEEAREEQARLAVDEERARIARELHDVVGHSVSVMTVQASAVRRLLEEDQEKEREALMVVEQTGREALAEMRRMVGVLRRPEEAPALAPQPSLERLDALIENARERGLPVELRIEGTPEQLPAGVDLTAYRIVQEGLTNAIKHARAKHAEVVVRYDNGHVELTVSDDGSGDGDGEGSGHGLVGMRERVSVYGGEIEAGPRAGGGYRLRARLPVT